MEAVTRVDGALVDITDDVAEVHALLATMAVDNRAQSAAITQISATIGTMDQTTQQNAAMVEQTSAAARNLANEVGTLADHAVRFTIGRGQPRHRTNAKPDHSRHAGSPVGRPEAATIPAMAHAANDWNAF